MEKEIAGRSAVRWIAWLDLGSSIQLSIVAMIAAAVPWRNLESTEKDEADDHRQTANQNQKRGRSHDGTEQQRDQADRTKTNGPADTPRTWRIRRRWTKARLDEVRSRCCLRGFWSALRAWCHEV